MAKDPKKDPSNPSTGEGIDESTASRPASAAPAPAVAGSVSMARSLGKRLLASHLPVWLIDDSGYLRFANQSLSDLLQTPMEALIGLDCTDRIAEDGKAANIAMMLSIPKPFVMRMRSPLEPPIDGQPVSQDGAWWVPLPDGRWFRGNAIPLESDEGTEWLGWLLPASGPPTNELTDSIEGAQAWLKATRLRYRTLDALRPLQGRSIAAQRAMRQTQGAIAADGPVLIVAPHGGLAHQVAHAVQLHRWRHRGTPEHRGIFLPVDCRLIDEKTWRQTTESFPGGPAAESTAIFLDCLDEVPPQMVGRLLDALLQHHAKLTWSASVQADSIPARRDDSPWCQLLSCLDIHRIDLEPLAHRSQDVPILVEACLRSSSLPSLASSPGVSESAMRFLSAYLWPGDLEELEQVLQLAARRAAGKWIDEKHLPPVVRGFAGWAEQAHSRLAPIDMDRLLEDLEKQLITASLKRHRGNRAAAAAHLGISRNRLLRRLEQWNIVLAELTSSEILSPNAPPDTSLKHAPERIGQDTTPPAAAPGIVESELMPQEATDEETIEFREME
ncbi:MAG: helix-turn-helix domain-containing protein [Pirellulaceae bacterium]